MIVHYDVNAVNTTVSKVFQPEEEIQTHSELSFKHLVSLTQ